MFHSDDAPQKSGYKYSPLDENDLNTIAEAEQKLIVPGLRAGHYLCFFGMHVLTAAVMGLLDEEIAAARGGPVHLTPARELK